MAEISYRGHRFPPIVIQHAVWLYLRFTLSYRDVEELLAERGLDVSYETVRSWVLKFGPIIARRLRRSRPRPSNRWHLDEMVVRIAGKHMYFWRAVDDGGEVLEILVQRRRDKCAAVKLMRKLLRKQGVAPKTVTTDKLRSYSAAFQHLGLPATMSRECDRTIGPRTHIRWCDDGSASCSASNHRAPPSASSVCTPLSTTHSTFSGILSLARPFGSSDQMQLRNGAARPPSHEAEPVAPHLGRNGST
jgi:transposase-like protein